MRTRKKITLVAAACLAAGLGLTGCTAGGSSATPTATKSVTVTPEPTPTSSPSTTAPAPAPSTTTPADQGTGAGGAGADGTAAACTSAHLSAGIAEGSGGAAGSVGVELQLTNTGTTDCTLQGWPGVSLVGSGNGTQIGQAAKFDRSTTHATVALKPGTAAVAELKYTQAGNYDASKCQPLKADGFRVYPPGQKASVFAKYTGATGCKSKSVSLLVVGALH